ncbi:MAG: ATP-binding protein [Pseudomonadota bacterium]
MSALRRPISSKLYTELVAMRRSMRDATGPRYIGTTIIMLNLGYVTAFGPALTVMFLVLALYTIEIFALNRLSPRSTQSWYWFVVGQHFVTNMIFCFGGLLFLVSANPLPHAYFAGLLMGAIVFIISCANAANIPYAFAGAAPFFLAAPLVGIRISEATGLELYITLGYISAAVMALYFWCVLRSNHKVLVEYLDSRHQAERKAEARERYMSHLSHEMRTALSGVASVADILAEDDTLSEKSTEIATLKRSSNLLRGLVDDVLDLDAATNGEIQIRRKSVDLAAELKEAVGVFEHRAAAKSLFLDLDIAPGVPRWVLADILRIDQVLGNLIANALRHTSEGGVTIRALLSDEQFEPSATSCTRVAIDVIDSGPGVPKARRTRLFDGFDARQRSVGEGRSGLGLSISREIARAMSGDIELLDKDDGTAGARFRFTFTIRMSDPPTVLTHAESIPELGHWTILIVDDVATNRFVLGRMIAQTGATIVEAETGEEALAITETSEPDLVLLDINLPDMSGHEVLAGLRAADVRAPAIAVTANMVGETPLSQLGAFDHWFVKPIERKALLALLSELKANQDVELAPLAGE